MGMMVPPTQASSGLELKALLHKNTCIASFCKAIPFLHWSHLTTTPWSVQKCKAFPQWVLIEKGLLSPRLKGAVTSQREFIHEEYEWAAFYTLPVWLTCWNWNLLGWWILFCTVIQHSGIGKSFCISSSSLPGGDPKQLIETYFWKGIKWKEFPNLSWMEH